MCEAASSLQFELEVHLGSFISLTTLLSSNVAEALFTCQEHSTCQCPLVACLTLKQVEMLAQHKAGATMEDKTLYGMLYSNTSRMLDWQMSGLNANQP